MFVVLFSFSLFSKQWIHLQINLIYLNVIIIICDYIFLKKESIKMFYNLLFEMIREGSAALV